MVFSRRNDPRERARTTRLIYLMRPSARTCYSTTRNVRCVTTGASITGVRSNSTPPKGGLFFLAGASSASSCSAAHRVSHSWRSRPGSLKPVGTA